MSSEDVFEIKTNILVLAISLQDVFIRLHDVFKMSLRRLQDTFKTSSRRLYQDEYIPLTHMSSEDVFKIKTNIPVLAIRLQDVFICLQDVLPRRLQNVFKISLRRLEDVCKTFSKRL